MKSISQPIKIFLILALSCTSSLAMVTYVLAKPILAPGSSLSDGETPAFSSPSPSETLTRTETLARTRRYAVSVRVASPLGEGLYGDRTTPQSPQSSNRERGNLFIPKLILAQVRYEPPALPPGPPPGGRIRGGAKRGLCPSVKHDLTALVPFTEEPNSVINVWGRTTLERPTWLFYVPYTKKFNYPTEFELQDLESNSIYKTAIALPDRPGVVRVSLPTNAPPLLLEKQYRWYFTIKCDQKDSPPSYVEGVIQRVNLSESIAQELKTAEPLKRSAMYAENGIWYDALKTLAQLRQQNPKDARIQAEWRNLLNGIRLDDVAAEPIIPEKP